MLRETGRKSELAEGIAGDRPRRQVETFLEGSFGLTRQHAYLWRLRRGASIPNDPLGMPNLVAASTDDHPGWFYLLPMRWNLLLVESKEVVAIPYEWPVMLSQIGNALVLRLIIRERDPRKFLETDERAVLVSCTLEEEQIVQGVASTCGDAIGKLDLNRGVKALWDDNIIDSIYVRSKRSHSVSTDAMDQDFLFKATYPERYAEVRQRPLHRVHFKWQTEPEHHVEQFIVDATRGFLAFPVFSKQDNGPENVIRAILRRN